MLGLLALLLLIDARRATRVDAEGDLVLLVDQDRSCWDRERIDEGAALVEVALRRSAGRAGPYALQAAIAACHATAPSGAAAVWREVTSLYALLEAAHPTPIVRLNRAVAVAEAERPGGRAGHGRCREPGSDVIEGSGQYAVVTR